MSQPRLNQLPHRKPRHRETMVTLHSGTSRAVSKDVSLEFARKLMDLYPDTWGKGWIEYYSGPDQQD